jgi:hypothetical protein
MELDHRHDLDAGRRVDKNNLNMIMGGAASNLKDKFQGGSIGKLESVKLSSCACKQSFAILVTVVFKER